MCHRIYGKPISVNREDDGIIMLKSETLHGFFPQTKSQRKLIKTISVTYSLIIEVMLTFSNENYRTKTKCLIFFVK